MTSLSIASNKERTTSQEKKTMAQCCDNRSSSQMSGNSCTMVLARQNLALLRRQTEMVVAASRLHQPTRTTSYMISAAVSRDRSKAPTKKTSTKKTAPPRKAGATKVKVRFAPADKMIMSIANRHEVMRIEDVLEAWYQPKDYFQIKLGILNSIQAIGGVFSAEVNEVNNGDGPAQTTPMLDLSEHCLRGIETGISSEIYQSRKIRIHTTKQLVLEQQRIFRCMGVAADPQILRRVSIEGSQSATTSALAVAQLDAKAHTAAE